MPNWSDCGIVAWSDQISPALRIYESTRISVLDKDPLSGCGRNVLVGRAEYLTAQEVQARRGMPPLKITRVRTIQTRANAAWTIVKIETSEPGLYGIGSASDLFRPGTIPPAVEVLSQGILGRDPDEIEDIWQSNYMSSLWRNNATMNVALGGVDVALWDLKGKRANMPIYQLLGGRCRAAVPVYDHAREEKSFEGVADGVRRSLENVAILSAGPPD
jgi:hypothetical protein